MTHPVDNLLHRSVLGKASFIARGIISLSLIFLLIAVSLRIGEEHVGQIDYLNSHYVAGLMVLQGRISQVYPSKTDTTFATTEFNRFAHDRFSNSLSRQDTVC